MVQDKHLIVHLGSSQVLESTRKTVIGQVLDLVAVTKALYPDVSLIFSSVIPRPIDHQQTDKAVVAYNHAIKTAVSVASRRYESVAYLPNHHLFTNEDGSYSQQLYHKKEIRVSRKGAEVLKKNFLQIVPLD